jgi:hypothetical protein
MARGSSSYEKKGWNAEVDAIAIKTNKIKNVIKEIKKHGIINGQL